ncbi:Ig-like domain-containing protein [Hymenobacter sp. PAMC 26628]|uniref:Ig-like domain-containing protein n=1 Tax=Hymenobacter sp. PAMC 26628 TaxID=1484118 RepID=UPI0012FF7B24|nr:Ig-like domain-containing protein [Hymenobacter sp. PAMC 26628]
MNTNEPVVLDGCSLAGAGNLIQAGEGANLTVRNCRGQGLAPSVDNQAPGRFIDSYRAQRLVVEHNELVQTSGIVVNRWSGTGGGGQTLTVRYNRVRNIDGRWRNGGSARSSFLILNTVQHLAGVDVAYNEVINAPNQSLVEDNINLYNSSGTADSPVHVHDNFVRGAYPFPATDGQFTGTGLTTDGDAGTMDGAAAYIEADHNQFVSTCNAAMNIAAGHDVYYHDNRLVTSGLLPDGSRLQATYAATAVFNYYQQLASLFFNNRIENNVIGFVRWGANNPFPDRQDLSPGNCDACTGTVHLPNPVTLATEDNEGALWAQKLQQNGVVVGPLGAAAPAPPVVVATGQVVNPGFEADGAASGSPTGWQTGAGSDAKSIYTESFAGAHTGTYHATHYRYSAYEVYTYQVVSGLPSGTYAFSAWVKSSGGQTAAQMRASNYGGPVLTADIAATPGGEKAAGWVLLTVANVAVTNGRCEIGFYSKADANQAIYFDDVTLAPQSAAAPNLAPTVALSAPSALTLGQAVALSATAADTDGTVVKVEFYNGATKLGEATAAPYQLSWTPAAAGTYTLTAVATDNAAASTTSATVSVAVAAPAPAPVGAGTNLVANPGFEAGGLPVGAPAGWQTATGASTNDNADYTEAYPGPHAGLYHGTHYRPDKYEVYTYQTISNLPAGTYTLRAWVKSSGGQPRAEMRASNYGGDMRVANLGTSMSGWTLVQIPNISVVSGRAEIGFYSKASGGQWLYFDDVEFVLQPTATGANTVINASFDDDLLPRWDPRQWTTQAFGATRIFASYIEAYPGAHSGLYHGTHYRPEAYEVYTYQTISNLAAGTYALRAWVKSSGGQTTVQMRASNYGGDLVSAAVPDTPDGQWVQITLPNITVSNGQCEIGFYSKASGGQSFYYDDVELVLQSGASAAAGATASAAAIALAAGSTLFPNPADDQVTVSVNFLQSTAVTLVVTDMQGAPIARSQQQATAGDNQFVLDTRNLPSGIYALQIQSSQPTLVERLEVRH